MNGSMRSEPFLPYSRQSVSEDDIQAVVDVLRSDWLTTGPQVDSFEQQLAVYFSLLIVFVICLVAGIYALGAPLADRFKHAFDWDEQVGDLG